MSVGAWSFFIDNAPVYKYFGYFGLTFVIAISPEKYSRTLKAVVDISDLDRHFNAAFSLLSG